MPTILSDADFEKQYGGSAAPKKKVLSDADFAAQYEKPPEDPSIVSSVLKAAKGMVVPTEPETGDARTDWGRVGTAISGAIDFARPRGLAFTQEQADFARGLENKREAEIDQARAQYPKTHLAAGLLAPFPTKVKGQMVVSGVQGAIHGYEHGGAKQALVEGGINAAAAGVLGKTIEGGAKLLSPVAKSVGRALFGTEGASLTKQMAATLGPEGPAFADDLEQMGAQSARTQVSGVADRGTVPDYRVGPGTVSGPAPGVGTVADRPGVRGQEVTNVRADKGATGVFEPPPGQGTVGDKPYYQPGKGRPARNEAPLESAAGPDQPRVSREPGGPRLNEAPGEGPLAAPNDTFVGKVTPGEREAAMFDAGKTRLSVPNTPESIEAAAANIERMAAERGLKPVEQGLRNGQYPGINERGKSLGDPTFIEKGLIEGQGTKSLRVPVKGSAKFQEAMDFLTGEDELGKTATKFVARDSLLPRSQQNPDATFVKSGRLNPEVGGGSGKPEVNPEAHPVPGPPFESGPLTEVDVPDSFSTHAAEAAAALKKDQSLWEKVKRGLSLPENRADEEVAAAIRSFKGARAMREVGMKMYAKLQDTLKALPVADRARVQKIIVGLRDRKLGREAVDQLPRGFRALFNSFEKEKQEMLISLAREGYYTPKEMLRMKRTLDDGELHLHRSYQAFLAKKGYQPTPEAIAEAARFVAKETGLSEFAAVREVEAKVRRLFEEGLNSPNDLAAAFRDAGLLKSRKLPPQLHRLLGVVNDPAFIVADSLGEMAQQYHVARVTNAFASPEYRGKVWSDSAAPGMDPRQLWDATKDLAGNKRMFGELAGKWVKPELYEAMAMNATPEAQTFGKQIMNAAVGWFAVAKVTSSPATWLRNFLSNSYNLFVSGVPPQHYLDPRVVNRALKALSASSKRTSMKEAGAGEWARMALEDWAIPEGRGTDWGGSEAQRIIDEAVRGSPGGLVGVIDKVFRLYNKGRGKLGAAYEFADQLPRLIGYIYHVEKGVKLGMPEMAARARASHLITRYFATGASVGPAMRGLAQRGGAPFSAWFVDNMRVAKNIGADSLKGDFGSLARSALYMGGVASAFYAARQIGGFTDTDVAAGNRALKGSWNDATAFHDWLPFRDSKGNMYAVSFDGLNPMATFFKGPEGSPVKNVATNIVRGMTQSGLLQMPADMLLAQAGIAPQEYRPPVLPGQEGSALANTAWSYMQPTLVNQFRNVTRKAQLSSEPLRDGEEPETLGEAFLLHGPLQPLSVEKVGPHTAEGKRRQEQGAIGELKDARKAVKRQPADVQTKVREEANRRLEEKRRLQRR